MNIHGINKLTLLDFPGHTACTLFTGGCNFRCPFCQNGILVLSPQTEPVIDEGWLFEFLKKRSNVLQGVCITGGEPTIQGDLAAFICRVSELGYKIKLDTNGYRPEVLEQLLEDGLLDGVAMDIKSSPESYARVCGLEGSSDHVGKAGTAADVCGEKHGSESARARFRFENIERSVALLTEYGQLHPDFYYEFRTTLVKGLHTLDDMKSIGKWLSGAPHYYLQHYEESEYVLKNIDPAATDKSAGAEYTDDIETSDNGFTAFSQKEMQEMADIVKSDIPTVQIRGI